MQELLKDVLKGVLNRARKSTPQTKKSVRSISIIDVDPFDLQNFMKDNNIPESAYFHGRDNGYDAWDDIILEWTVDVPTTDEDKDNYVRDRFNASAFKNVYDALTTNGYTRVGYSTGLLKEFKDTTIYDMFIEEDFDRLEKYYSLPFKKV